jgi:hypothetical protein
MAKNNPEPKILPPDEVDLLQEQWRPPSKNKRREEKT